MVMTNLLKQAVERAAALLSHEDQDELGGRILKLLDGDGHTESRLGQALTNLDGLDQPEADFEMED